MRGISCVPSFGFRVALCELTVIRFLRQFMVSGVRSKKVSGVGCQVSGLKAVKLKSEN